MPEPLHRRPVHKLTVQGPRGLSRAVAKSEEWHSTKVPLVALLALGCAVLASAAAPVVAASAPAAGPAGPALDSEQIAIAYVPGSLDFFDVLQVANPQSAALHQIRFPLVAGAEDVQVHLGGDAAAAKVVKGELVLPVSLPAQAHTTVAFSYVVPAQHLPVSIMRPVDFPTAQLAIVMRANQLSLRTTSLAAMGTIQVNGLTVRQFGAAAVAPGTVLAFTAIPAPSWLDQKAAAFTPTVWLVIASCALAGLLVVGMRSDAARRGA